MSQPSGNEPDSARQEEVVPEVDSLGEVPSLPPTDRGTPPLLRQPAAPEAAPPPAIPGYEILAELGRGGMGVVWRAHDVRLDRHVALKLLGEQYAGQAAAAARFVAEAKITGQLQHSGGGLPGRRPARPRPAPV